jgi:hypothetical protein
VRPELNRIRSFGTAFGVGWSDAVERVSRPIERPVDHAW